LVGVGPAHHPHTALTAAASSAAPHFAATRSAAFARSASAFAPALSSSFAGCYHFGFGQSAAAICVGAFEHACLAFSAALCTIGAACFACGGHFGGTNLTIAIRIGGGTALRTARFAVIPAQLTIRIRIHFGKTFGGFGLGFFERYDAIIIRIRSSKAAFSMMIGKGNPCAAKGKRRGRKSECKFTHNESFQNCLIRKKELRRSTPSVGPAGER
jgi:hypothetical protein